MNPKVLSAEALVRKLLRTIDKRAECNVTPVEEDGPKLKVSLSLRKKAASLNLRLDDLDAAEHDLMRRNQVRAAIKRTLDKMMFQETSIASTAMLRPDSHAEGFFRSPNMGKKRR